MENTKKCCRCQNIKEFKEFNKCKTGIFGIHNHCRSCQKECKKEWHNKNKEYVKEYSQRTEIKEAVRKRAHQKYQEDEEYRKRHLENNKIRRRGEAAKIKQRANEKLRREINPSYRLRANFNTRLKNIMKKLGKGKDGSIIDFIGCSMTELTNHIESLWKEGMSWENYGYGPGKWETDHKIPCCAFDLSDPEQVKVCYHYSNLQPLWREENLKKGAKMPDGSDARKFNQTRGYRKIVEIWSNYSI